MEITLAEITRWATTDELDERFDQLQEEDAERFEAEVLGNCDDHTLLTFLSNRESTKRAFFAQGLVQRLVKQIYAPHRLPYPFSRFQGMMAWEEFQNIEFERNQMVYQACRMIEQMRASGLDEVKNLADMILDYRHDRLYPSANTTKLLYLLYYQIDKSLRPGVTSYKYRLCEKCNDGFKSWIINGNENESRKCPFCILEITYPQKNGKNSGT